ncbi:MAG TPA: FimV/HubP family polar landmark protein, partial [Burkholderiales bacterium]|nr:FimV/HubP family polar landmark protein [Burkholderiales bacterium]
LAAEWPGGRIVREYTALVDPPSQALGKASGIEVPAAAPVISPARPPEQPKPEPVAKSEPEPVAPVIEKPEAQSQTQPQATPPPAADTASQQPSAAAPPLASSTPPATIEPTPAPEPQAPPVRATTSSSSAPSVGKGWAMEGGYNVKWGDTAWRIAEQVRTDGQTIEQVVLALYRANPQAFFGNNVNNLKSGQILKVPEGTQIESTTAVQARTEFRAQYDAWQEYKIKLAGASSAIKVVDNETKQAAVAPATKEQPVAKKEPEIKTESETKPEPKKEPANVAKAPPAPKGAQQDELLKIVRSTLQGDKTTPDKKPAEGEVAKGAKEQQALADRVTTLEESLASKQHETREIGDKVAQVRAQLKREARLIQIEQQQLAQAQEKAKAPEPMPKAEPPKPEPAPKAEPTPAPKAEAPKKVEPPKPEPSVAPPPAAPKTAVAAASKVAPPPPPSATESSFVDDIVSNLLSGDSFLPMLIGGVALASIVIGFVYMKRRRKSIAEFEESILQSEGIPGTTGEPNLTTDTSGQVVSSGDTSFLSDFSQGGMGNIHTDEVDPIAEAEVYLAYGRDETAEEILKEAVVKNPAREELKLKLLEIYANRSDVRAFETLAEEMYASMGGRPSKNWPRIEELGKKLNPNNPMFKGGAVAPAVVKTPPPPSFADTAKMKAINPSAASDTQTGMTAPTAIADAGDFDFDMASPAPAAAADADGGLDFDMGGSAKTAVADSSLDFSADLGTTSDDVGLDMDVGTSAPTNGAGGGVDFDFGEKEEIATAMPEAEVAMETSAASAAVGEVTEAPQWDETATKLDLARAYIDMGDSEGARSILDEVMSEGNDQQKKQAKELAAQLA